MEYANITSESIHQPFSLLCSSNFEGKLFIRVIRIYHNSKITPIHQDELWESIHSKVKIASVHQKIKNIMDGNDRK